MDTMSTSQADQQARVSVHCVNEECPNHSEKTLQRSWRTWDRKPCPRCGSAVKLGPEVALPPTEPLPANEAPPQVNRYVPRPAPLEIGERVQVNVATMRTLMSQPRIRPHEAARKVLDLLQERGELAGLLDACCGSE